MGNPNHDYINEAIVTRNKIFAVLYLILQFIFCWLYGYYVRPITYPIAYGGVKELANAAGIAFLCIVGFGLLMTYVNKLSWSGIGFAFLIVALTFQYYFLVNAFWTKADIQQTQILASGAATTEQFYKNKFAVYLTQAYGSVQKTFGETASGAFKCALSIIVAFSAVIGRAGPLQILLFVLFGGLIYQLNRQIISTYITDIGGSITIFLFGGMMGTVVSIILSLTKQKQFLTNSPKYTSNRFATTTAMLGAVFCYIFFPFLHLDVPTITNGFLENVGVINCLYAMSASVVTSLALSAVIYGRINIKDLLYSPICGAIMVGTSAQFIINPMAAIILGMIAGFIQPLFNIIQKRLAGSHVYFCTSAPFLFMLQGLFGGIASIILRAIKENNTSFDYSLYPYQFSQINISRDYVKATFISFGIAIGAGFILGLFVFLASAQQEGDFFEDRAYWIINDDGISHKPKQGQIKQGDQIKGIHAYL